MANSVVVNGPCVVSPANVPSMVFTGGEVVQPYSPYFFPLVWSGLATDSGQSQIPGVDTTYTKVTVSSGAPANPSVGDIWIDNS